MNQIPFKSKNYVPIYFNPPGHSVLFNHYQWTVVSYYISLVPGDSCELSLPGVHVIASTINYRRGWGRGEVRDVDQES